MSQKLASAKSDGRPIDFGTITFPNGQMLVVRGSYKNQWEFASKDVDLTDVADDYVIPVAPVEKPTANYRQLQSGSELIALMANAIGMSRLDELLEKSPSIVALLLGATKIDRAKGNTPAAIVRLKEIGLTDDELKNVDTLWAALK